MGPLQVFGLQAHEIKNFMPLLRRCCDFEALPGARGSFMNLDKLEHLLGKLYITQECSRACFLCARHPCTEAGLALKNLVYITSVYKGSSKFLPSPLRRCPDIKLHPLSITLLKGYYKLQSWKNRPYRRCTWVGRESKAGSLQSPHGKYNQNDVFRNRI